LSFIEIKNTALRDFPMPPHDHSQCIKAAVQKAAAICQVRGVRFTELRQLIFELVWSRHKPIVAYDILDTVQKLGRRAAPPTVYRALDFLLKQGLIHRIASLNAYIGCDSPQEPHQGQFLICEACGEAVELMCSAIEKCTAIAAEQVGFRIKSRIIEIHGLCAVCQRDNNVIN